MFHSKLCNECNFQIGSLSSNLNFRIYFKYLKHLEQRFLLVLEICSSSLFFEENLRSAPWKKFGNHWSRRLFWNFTNGCGPSEGFWTPMHRPGFKFSVLRSNGHDHETSLRLNSLLFLRIEVNVCTGVNFTNILRAAFSY